MAYRTWWDGSFCLQLLDACQKLCTRIPLVSVQRQIRVWRVLWCALLLWITILQSSRRYSLTRIFSVMNVNFLPCG
uniref:GDSL esterase/lipase 5-like isoform X1 n=1 Tax=Rhizophora mucronata TaxID=61149 RepID=A0A2P2QP85_RHIMU